MSMLDIEKRLAKQQSIKESTSSVVAENDTWTVYKATNEASMKKYGRDARWAMTQMWDKYIERGLQAVYIFIKKGEIDRRGKTDKYAVCVFSNGEQTIFDQQDKEVKAIPNTAGISISGVKLGKVVKESIKSTKAELKEMIRRVLKEELANRKSLKEGRSSAEIQADIEKLKQELADAKVAEKRASSSGTASGEVWYWDMYITPRRKGTWTSIENDTVFETEEDAIDGAWTLLGELEDEGELRGDPDDYTIDAIKIPISKVAPEVLKGSHLEHLIPSDAKVYPVLCCACHKLFKISQEDKDKNIFNCDHCGASLQVN